MTSLAVCPDACFLAKLALFEEGSEEAEALWIDWRRSEIDIVAPRLVLYEFVSIVAKQLRIGSLTEREATTALGALLSLPIRLATAGYLHLNAFDISREFKLSGTYDAHYLAVARELDCEFWTADKRLFNSVSGRFPLIRLLRAA